MEHAISLKTYDRQNKKYGFLVQRLTTPAWPLREMDVEKLNDQVFYGRGGTEHFDAEQAALALFWLNATQRGPSSDGGEARMGIHPQSAKAMGGGKDRKALHDVLMQGLKKLGSGSVASSRAAVAVALQYGILAPEHATHISHALKDPEAEVRAVALAILANAKPNDLDKLVVAALSDKEPFVREVAEAIRTHYALPSQP